MPETVLELHRMPENYCFDAGLARVFIDEAVVHLDELAKEPDHRQVDGTKLTDEEIDAKVKRVSMASDFLLDYVSECDICERGDEPEVCPMISAFDFVRSIAEVRRIKTKPSRN